MLSHQLLLVLLTTNGEALFWHCLVVCSLCNWWYCPNIKCIMVSTVITRLITLLSKSALFLINAILLISAPTPPPPLKMLCQKAILSKKVTF